MWTWPRSWWQQIKKHRVAIGVIYIVLAVVILLIIAGYWFDWTGFNGYNKITVAHTISGINAGTVIRTEEYQPGRTFWDWMQLLIIPVVLAVGGYAINLTISRGEQEATRQRAKTEYEIAADNQREIALQDYIDKMSELLLDKDHPLRESAPEDEVRKIARVRTLTVLQRLDAERKRNVLLFLHESGFIDKNKRIIDLKGTELKETNLKYADLHGADLRGVNLHKANLGFADLGEADLREVNLSRADLGGANLSGVDLSGANLQRAYLVEVNMGNTDLHGASLYAAGLTRAYLGGADLSGADLRNATMYETKLVGANLNGTNLRGALVNIELLDKAKSLKGATMPDGSIHP